MITKINFQPSDILWIKSVKRTGGYEWAYTEYNVGDTFTLHFSKNPKWYPTNYEKVKPGELIVLFQRISNHQYKEGWYITHLVSPLDNKVSKVENNPNHPYVRLVAVIATLTEYIPINEREWSLFNCNRGQICDIEKITNKTYINLSRSFKQDYVWNLFHNIEPELYQNINIDEMPVELDDMEVEEGTERTKLKNHRYKERNPTIIKEAKRLAKLKGNLKCIVCNFDFEKVYNLLGKDFIECHHKLPIANGGVRKTKIKDLELVCSNCHRMLHRKNEFGNYLSTIDLRRLLQDNNFKNADF